MLQGPPDRLYQRSKVLIEVLFSANEGKSSSTNIIVDDLKKIFRLEWTILWHNTYYHENINLKSNRNFPYIVAYTEKERERERQTDRQTDKHTPHIHSHSNSVSQHLIEEWFSSREENSVRFITVWHHMHSFPRFVWFLVLCAKGKTNQLNILWFTAI